MSDIMDYWKGLESQKRYDEALTYIKMDIEQGTASYDIRKDEGRIFNKQSKYKNALKNFDIVPMNENHPECFFGKGISFLGLFEWKNAYESFIKSIKLDDTNANARYYLAIILKDSGFEQESRKYFQEFLKLDNDEFKAERECYNFGLIFEQRKNELYGVKKTINIEGFKEEFKSLNVPLEDMDCYLHCLPYNELIEKILNLREVKYYEDVKNIIYNELNQLGLTDTSISNMFEVETLDNLKEKIISQKESDPFPILNNDLDISYYVKTGLEAHVDKYIKQGYSIIPNVSKFNMLRGEIKLKNTPFNINGISFNGLNSKGEYKDKNEAKNCYDYGKRLILNDDVNGLCYLNFALQICPMDSPLYYNIKFYFATTLSRFGYLQRSLKYYIELKNTRKSFKKLDSFLFNLGNIYYDLNAFKEAAQFYNEYLKKNPDCEVVKILKNHAKNMY